MINKLKSIIFSKKFILILSSIEVILIMTVFVNIYHKKNVLGVVINNVHKENIYYPADSKLKYFYEINANTKTDNPFPGYDSKGVHYHINSDGLSAMEDYPVKKGEDTFRIMTLGDSWTFGFLVDTKDNYSQQLEQILNSLSCKNIKKFEVINLGVYGYDIEYSLERFRLRGQKYNPDLIVWLLEEHNFTRPNELVLPQVKQREDINDPKVWMKATKNIDPKVLDEYDWNALNKANDYYNGPLVLDLTNVEDHFKEMAQKFQASRSNTYGLYSTKLTDAESIPNDGHPNVLGHSKIAQDLFKFMADNKLIQCSK